MVAPSVLTGQRSAQPATAVNALFAAGESVSAAIDLDSDRLHRITLPATWTAASISFLASASGDTYFDVYTIAGEYVLSSAIVDVSRTIVVDPAVFFGIRFLKLRSGSSSTPTPQVAARSLKLVTVPR